LSLGKCRPIVFGVNVDLSYLMKHSKSYILHEAFFGPILRTPGSVRRARRKALYARKSKYPNLN